VSSPGVPTTPRKGDNVLFDLLSGNAILLIFSVIGLGYLLGNVRIAGFSLGPAAVLFTGLFFGAIDPRLRIPDVLSVLGLVLFVYTIGVQSGPTFFSSFGPRTLRANLIAFGGIFLAAVLTLVFTRLFALDGPSMVGVFCGSLTNTPALASSIDLLRQVTSSSGEAAQQTAMSAPVIGYSMAYPFGVVGVLLAFHLFGKTKSARRPKEESGAEARRDSHGIISSRTFKVSNPGVTGRQVASVMTDRSGFVLSRLRRGNVTSLVYGDTVLELGDLVVAVGDEMALNRAHVMLGEIASTEIQWENREFEFRRIEVSSRNVVGKTVGALDLQRLLDSTVTRIRRGDVDFVPNSDTVLERGDRVRVLTWAGNMERLAKFLGDSIRTSSETDFLSLSLGLVGGVLLGIAPLPLPNGKTFTLGFAGGPLIAGLVLGRIQRTGSISWGMPFSVNLTLRQVGLVLFLAAIGTKAGAEFLTTIEHGGVALMAIGALMTVAVTSVVMSLGSKLLRLPFAAVLGLMSGIQTQPACLAYANEKSGNDLSNVWYAAVYPTSMIAKIILAQLLVGWIAFG
jgi:putative transport protein